MVGLGLVVYQVIIEPPQLTLFDSVLDWVVAIIDQLYKRQPCEPYIWTVDI